jgi:hypothetical protein
MAMVTGICVFEHLDNASYRQHKSLKGLLGQAVVFIFQERLVPIYLFSNSLSNKCLTWLISMMLGTFANQHLSANYVTIWPDHRH